jgi:hypothetical protein
MKIKINRFKNIYDGTIGKLTIVDDGKRLFECFTLEPAGPDTTERGKDRRIPAGRYKMQWYASPSQKRMCPLLWNESVPKDRYILIHTGNYPQKTSGCILVGDGHNAAGVTNSVQTYNSFFKICTGKHIEFIEITNEEGI